MPPARPREGAAEAPVPWFPRRKRGPGRRASAEAKRAPGRAGRLALADSRLSRRRPASLTPRRASLPGAGGRAGVQREGAGPKRTAGSREAAASARRPAPSFYPERGGGPRPPLAHLHTRLPASRRGRPGAPRRAVAAERPGAAPALGPPPRGGWVPAGFWGASGGEGGSPARDVAEARDGNDREERARRSTRVGDARPPRLPPRSPPPTPACGEPAPGLGNHRPRGLICGKKRNRCTYVFGTHLGRGPSLPVRVGVSLLGLLRKLSTVPCAHLTSPPFETALDSGGFKMYCLTTTVWVRDPCCLKKERETPEVNLGMLKNKNS